MSNGQEETQTQKAVKDFIAKFKNLELFIPEALEEIITTKYVTVEASTERIINALMYELIRPEIEKWSNDLGKMTFEDAKLECEKLGLQLPTREDLQKAHTFGITKEWEKNTKGLKKDKFGFWSSEECDKEHAYALYLDGNPFGSPSKTSEQHVRGIKLLQKNK